MIEQDLRLPSSCPRRPCAEVVIKGGVEPPTFRFSGWRTD